MKAAASPEGSPWLWTLAFGHHEDRTPTHGYEPTRDTAMAACAKSWRRDAQAASIALGVQKRLAFVVD
jgi:hypothetical protein